MNELLKKLNYKDEEEILVLNLPENLKEQIIEFEKEVKVQRNIELSKNYSFILAFVYESKELLKYMDLVNNNLVDNGVLWFAYPKKTSKKYKSDVSRDTGWEPLQALDFQGVRLISIDEDWSVMRFRNSKYIKTSRK